MAKINTQTLVSGVQATIDGLTKNSNANDFLLPDISSIDGNVKSSVPTADDLPDLGATCVPSGQVVFVESLNVPVISSRERWVGLDGRLLRDDATLKGAWTWGFNLQGQLGDYTSVDKSSPVSVVGGFTDWCQVSSGQSHTAAVRTNGTMWSWGLNSQGRLGDGTTVVRSSPVSVVGGLTDWCQVSGGLYHTAAVRTNGTLWSWGWNNAGRLGDGTTVDKSSPVSVIGGYTDWCQVSAGVTHTAAVRSNGTLWAWGDNGSGQLGDGTTVSKSSPVSVIGGFTDWCQVSAGFVHTAAVRTNGTLWSWGSGTAGRLGDGTTINKSSPVSVVGGFTDWCQVSVYGQRGIALRSNGTLWSWGWNSAGGLGDGTTVDRSSPVSVVGGFTDWCQVSASAYHSAAIRTNGTMWSWGSNLSGRLGDGTTINKSSPVSVVGGFTDWCQVSASCAHNIALRIQQ